MKFFFHIGRYFLMIKYTFTKFTKWSVLKKLIFQEIDDLILSVGARFVKYPSRTDEAFARELKADAKKSEMISKMIIADCKRREVNA